MRTSPQLALLAQTKVRAYLKAVVRTFVPVVVGTVVGVVSQRTGADPATVTPYVVGSAALAYYAVVHALEHKWPKVGVLLGWIGAPSYPTPIAANVVQITSSSSTPPTGNAA